MMEKWPPHIQPPPHPPFSLSRMARIKVTVWSVSRDSTVIIINKRRVRYYRSSVYWVGTGSLGTSDLINKKGSGSYCGVMRCAKKWSHGPAVAPGSRSDSYKAVGTNVMFEQQLPPRLRWPDCGWMLPRAPEYIPGCDGWAKAGHGMARLAPPYDRQ